MKKKSTTQRSETPSRGSKPTTTTPEGASGVNEEHGAPIEHYRGEPNQGKYTGDPGSLEEETRDPSAPYNKSYGV